MSANYNTYGISEDLVENFNECEELIKSLYCCICLEIVKNPFECENCESLYCSECWNMMKITGKKCVYNCLNEIIKAKKFVFDMLNKIRFRCKDCDKRNIPYKAYILHLEICLLNKKLINSEEAKRFLDESKSKIDKLTEELEYVKNIDKINNSTNLNSSVSNNNSIHNSNLTKDEIRNMFITSNLSVTQKKELYNSVFEGNLNNFKELIFNKKYNILEEISAKSYYWTSFHYAMHYGKYDMINFIMDYYKEKNLNLIMRLESNDGRCPILCLLKSNSINTANKKELLEKLFTKHKFLISKEITREMKNRDLDSLIDKFKLISYN